MHAKLRAVTRNLESIQVALWNKEDREGDERRPTERRRSEKSASNDAEPPEPQVPVHDAAKYVESIIEAAERAAAQIRDDAESEARRYLEEYKRRVDDLVKERTRATDTLVEQAGKAKAQYEKFLDSVNSALDRAPKQTNGTERSERGGDPLAPPVEQPRGMLDRVPGLGRGEDRTAVADARPERDPAPPNNRGVTRGGFRPRAQGNAPRDLAAQMAAAGSSKKAIAERLRDEYGIEDPSDVLDGLD